ncbi:MAG: GH92 family glycosyl hydrolase [Bacteroidota bacterium]
MNNWKLSTKMLAMWYYSLRYFYLLVLSIFLLNCEKPKEGLTQYVDPFIGSDETDFVSLWRSEAGLYPGAVAPHGMLQLTPETKAPKKYLQGYFYKEDTIRRFSMTEHFSGWPGGSAGKGIFMPFSQDGFENIELNQLKSFYSHEQEEAEAGYYAVDLLEHDISCEFSSLIRSAIGRFAYDDAKKQNGIAYFGFKTFEALDENRFQATLSAGRREFQRTKMSIHLVIAFKEEVDLMEQGEKRKHWLIVPKEDQTKELNFKIGISYTSLENAQLNLETEIPDWDIKKIRKKVDSLWEKELSRVELTGNETDKVTFYTALYHASLLPLNVTDVNRQFPGFEKNEPLKEGEIHYHYFTPWDAFRTLHPLINFINPQKGKDYMASSLRYYKTYGSLPEPSVMTSVQMSLLYADALAQEIDFDVEMAYQGLSKMMLEQPYFRKEMPIYDSIGYVAYPMSYATTATMEFAHNDWALAKIADHLGKKEMAEKLYQRSLSYRSQFEPKSRFMKSKNADGSWAPVSIYAEADKWNMSWFVPHNNQDLINLMGGNEAFCDFLNRNFEEGHYVLDNECPMNFPFLFLYADRPDLTMKWVNKTLRQYFKNKPYGIPGNDDWGTMSSWFMWGAMGLFPAAPGTGELIITGPIFDKIVIHRTEEEQVLIEADGVSKENIYIQEASVNGEEVNSAFVSTKELVNGMLSFEMGNSANIDFGKEGPKPYSLTTAKPDFEVLSFSSTKNIVSSNQLFDLHTTISNRGSIGNYLVEVKEGDVVIYSGYFLLEENEAKDLSLPIRLFSGGKHQLTLEGKQVAITVVPANMTEKAIVFESVEVEPLVHVSKKAKYKSRFQNASGNELRFTPVLYVDGAEQQVFEELTIEPGEVIELVDSFQLEKLGFHTLQLNTGPTATFKVYEQAIEAMVVHFTFDEEGTEVKDKSGFDNHGIIHGKVDWVEGIEGKGLKLTNGYVSIPKSVSTAIEDNEMTMLCWYKPVTQKGKASLITKGTFHMLKLEGKWQIKFAAGSWGRGQCYHNAKPKPDNMKEPSWLDEWTHFAGVKDAKFIRVFTNGVEHNRLDHIGRLHGTDFEWRIGSNQVAEDQQAKGVIDEVMIFKGALNEEEIKEVVRLR